MRVFPWQTRQREYVYTNDYYCNNSFLFSGILAHSNDVRFRFFPFLWRMEKIWSCLNTIHTQRRLLLHIIYSYKCAKSLAKRFGGQTSWLSLHLRYQVIIEFGNVHIRTTKKEFRCSSCRPIKDSYMRIYMWGWRTTSESEKMSSRGCSRQCSDRISWSHPSHH